jgi:exodeoxyribonuclease V alpha subunit
MMAAIKYVLQRSSLDGHTYLEREKLIGLTSELLMVDVPDYDFTFMDLQLKGHIIIEEIEGEVCVFLSSFDKMEKFIAAKLFELTHVRLEQHDFSDKELENIEHEMGITFDETQKDAILQALTCGTLVITGGPGTGKTTTLNGIIKLFEERRQEVLLAAPTGRAAKRMAETTGKTAKTIHRLLEISGGAEGHQKFERNEDFPLEGDVIIIDETSMMDTMLTYHLLKAIVPGTRVILVGDQDQLPSVGPGNVLKDIINSGYIHTVKLQQIFRQAGESHIVVNAHKINSGEMIDLKNSSSDFFFVRRQDPRHVVDEIVTLIKTRLPKFAGLESSEGIQILTPTRKGLLGVDNLNLALQATLNPPDKNKTEKEYRTRLFREGDKVMQIKNNYNLSWRIMSDYGFTVDEGVGVFNGDMGQIVEINLYTEKVKVTFDDDRMVYYDFKGLDELDLAYAVTIHKSQGSEYPIVIMPMFKGPTMLLNRNLLYTGITRAKRYVVLVGDEQVVAQMIHNKREMLRNSALKQRILEVFSVQ